MLMLLQTPSTLLTPYASPADFFESEASSMFEICLDAAGMRYADPMHI